MTIIEVTTGKKLSVRVEPVVVEDYKKITKSKYWFNWKEEEEHKVFKLSLVESDDILGLVSLQDHLDESRVEIRLLAASKENRGINRIYNNIAGNLIAFACIRAVRLFGVYACVSLVPKTKLVDHYIEQYSMIKAGKSLFIDGRDLLQLILKYDHDEG